MPQRMSLDIRISDADDNFHVHENGNNTAGRKRNSLLAREVEESIAILHFIYLFYVLTQRVKLTICFFIYCRCFPVQ